jgi:hypothetical protein
MGRAITIREFFNATRRRYSAARAVSSAHLEAAVSNIGAFPGRNSGTPSLIAETALYSLSHTAPTGLFVVWCDCAATYGFHPA